MAFSLEKTQQEQALLAQIQKLSNQIQFEPTNRKLIEKHHALKRELENLQSVETTVETIETLREQYAAVQEELEQVKSQYETLREKLGQLDAKTNETPLRLKLKWYKNLLEKFSVEINEHAQKTVGEIKSLIDPNDLSVQSLIAEVVPENYSPNQSFETVLDQATALIRQKVSFVQNDTEINGWLTPKEALEWGCAEEEDLAVLTASVALALKAHQAFVVVAELENAQTHAFNLINFQNQYWVVDTSQLHALTDFKSDQAEEVLNRFSVNGQKIKRLLYRFDRDSYEQFF